MQHWQECTGFSFAWADA